MTDDLPAAYTGAVFDDEQGKRFGATPRAGKNLLSTKAAPLHRAPRPEPVRTPVRITKDGRRSVAGAVPPPSPKTERYTMPVVTPPDLVALGHLRKPGTTSVVRVKRPAQSIKQPVARVAPSVGVVPGQVVTDYIER